MQRKCDFLRGCCCSTTAAAAVAAAVAAAAAAAAARNMIITMMHTHLCFVSVAFGYWRQNHLFDDVVV